MRQNEQNILSAIELAEKLMELADKGDEFREDESCGVLFGIIRDSGYRIAALANKEKTNHIKNGKWCDE